MVSEEDLIRTVSAAFAQRLAAGEAVLHVRAAHRDRRRTSCRSPAWRTEVIRAGREASGRNDIRCTISIGGFVPKPHTPFQWAAQAHPDVVDGRLRKLRDAINSDRKLGRNIGMRYHDGKPIADRRPARPAATAGSAG